MDNEKNPTSWNLHACTSSPLLPVSGPADWFMSGTGEYIGAGESCDFSDTENCQGPTSQRRLSGIRFCGSTKETPFCVYHIKSVKFCDHTIIVLSPPWPKKIAQAWEFYIKKKKLPKTLKQLNSVQVIINPQILIPVLPKTFSPNDYIKSLSVQETCCISHVLH